MIKILLVEGDKSIVSSLTVFLQREECLLEMPEWFKMERAMCNFTS